MKKLKSTTILVCSMLLFAALPELHAASARVRCRVETGRLRIQVDGQDLPKGTYAAKVKNARTGKIVKTDPNKVKTVTTKIGDVDLDFDSTAGTADQDTFVSTTFAKVGDTVRARVQNSSGVTVAAASIACVSK